MIKVAEFKSLPNVIDYLTLHIMIYDWMFMVKGVEVDFEQQTCFVRNFDAILW